MNKAVRQIIIVLLPALFVGVLMLTYTIEHPTVAVGSPANIILATKLLILPVQLFTLFVTSAVLTITKKYKDAIYITTSFISGMSLFIFPAVSSVGWTAYPPLSVLLEQDIDTTGFYLPKQIFRICSWLQVGVILTMLLIARRSAEHR
jgi:heme/copper-type cytochrome/quinol oxidase subunit 1